MSDPSFASGQLRHFFVHGITGEGRPFRPSDWAERLAGVLACYRPGGSSSGRDGHLGYSPYVRPIVIGDVKCVMVDERLRELERMAFDFVMSFARDNDLPVYEGCALPERPKAGAAESTKAAAASAVVGEPDAALRPSP